MPDQGSTERVRRTASEQYVLPARAGKRSSFEIHTGVFEKSLVARGLLQRNRFPIVCNALRSRKFLLQNRLELVDVKAPPSGQSSTVVFTYHLLPADPQSVPAAQPSLLQLRGVLSDTYRTLGGAERFHKSQKRGLDR